MNFWIEFARRWFFFGCVALLCWALFGCSGNWKDFNYGPGDWAAENWGWDVSSVYTYEQYANPEITIEVVEGTIVCGDVMSEGCATINLADNTCHIRISPRAEPSLLRHELKHCHGYTHNSLGYMVPRHAMD